MEIETPKKTYTIKNWEIRLKSGAVATYNIREDKGETYRVVHYEADGAKWSEWNWPTQKRTSQIRVEEIAAIDYQEIEQEEIPAYKPKHKHAKSQSQSQSQAGNTTQA